MPDFVQYLYPNFFVRMYRLGGPKWQAFWEGNTTLVPWTFTDIFHGAFMALSEGRRDSPWRVVP